MALEQLENLRIASEKQRLEVRQKSNFKEIALSHSISRNKNIEDSEYYDIKKVLTEASEYYNWLINENYVFNENIEISRKKL